MELWYIYYIDPWFVVCVILAALGWLSHAYKQRMIVNALSLLVARADSTRFISGSGLITTVHSWRTSRIYDNGILIARVRLNWLGRKLYVSRFRYGNSGGQTVSTGVDPYMVFFPTQLSGAAYYVATGLTTVVGTIRTGVL